MKRFFYLFFSAALMIGLNSCDQCKDVTCENGGVCEDGTCECAPGYGGTSCETIEDACIANNVQCENDGVCEDGECDCATNYRGETCATYCVNGRYSRSNETCECYPGWDSDGCSNEMRLAWTGSYSVAATGCTEETISSMISTQEHPVADSIGIDVRYVSVTNLTTDGDTKGWGIINENNQLEIPRQKVRNEEDDNFWVESEAPVSMSGGSFTITINRQPVGVQGSIDCVLSYTKQ